MGARWNLRIAVARFFVLLAKSSVLRAVAAIPALALLATPTWAEEPASPRPASSPAPTVVPKPVSALLPPQTATVAQVQRGEAAHFENTLGMRFVPVRDVAVLFSVWEARVKDYRAFAQSPDFTRGRPRQWPTPDFTQDDDHPAVHVSWEDARDFCEWLTQRERQSGRIGAPQRYRLPSDEEWSRAVGLGKEDGGTPKERWVKSSRDLRYAGLHPWDKGRGTWPPPSGTAGNYAGQETDRKYLAAIPKYSDADVGTARVGGYGVNANGLYDLGGNAWEWCEEEYDPSEGKARVLRGASFFDVDERVLRSAFRYYEDPSARKQQVGFRPVLASESGR